MNKEMFEKQLAEAQSTIEDLRTQLRQSHSELEKTNSDLLQLTLEMEDRVAERTAELAQANRELKRSNEELQHFAYVASHDLQEPLRKIASYTQLLEKRYGGQFDEKADKFIGYVTDGVQRMQTLINDLLAYSRVGTRGRPFEPTDCEEVFETAVSNLETAITETEARVTHDPLPTVMADGRQLVQAFQNLIANGIKFRREEPPQIHVTAKQEENEWVFSIRDNGIGIDEQYAERIFVIFQRLHTRTEYAGTGIGLAICKKIVERHGGRIWLESNVGEGTAFYFTIPERTERHAGDDDAH